MAEYTTPKPITREDMYYDYLIKGGDAKKLPKPITRKEIYLNYLCQNGFGVGGGGAEGTTNYNALSNKPQINGVTLQGKLSSEDIGILTTKGTPVGEIISYMGVTAPPNYLVCDGTEYNIADYPYLAQHFVDNFEIVNYFGGNGETTFAVPDLQGEFLRGSGENSHTYTYNETVGKEGSGSQVGEHQGATINPMISANSFASGGWVGGWAGDVNIAGDTSNDRNFDSAIGTSKTLYFGNQTTNSSGDVGKPTIMTTRPTNTSVLYCIKYKST